jgi:hypothetical protein
VGTKAQKPQAPEGATKPFFLKGISFAAMRLQITSNTKPTACAVGYYPSLLRSLPDFAETSELFLPENFLHISVRHLI